MDDDSSRQGDALHASREKTPTAPTIKQTGADSKWPPFIPRGLDDAGFSPAEFRIVCRINRRAGKGGECTEAVENIAAGCRLHPDTVRAALKKLESINVIRIVDRKGKTNSMRLMDIGLWKPYGKEWRGEKDGGVTGGKAIEGNPPEMDGGKGSPRSKVGHLEKTLGGAMADTGAFQVPEFTDLPKPLRADKARVMLDDCAAAIEAIRKNGMVETGRNQANQPLLAMCPEAKAAKRQWEERALQIRVARAG